MTIAQFDLQSWCLPGGTKKTMKTANIQTRHPLNKNLKHLSQLAQQQSDGSWRCHYLPCCMIHILSIHYTEVK